MLFKPRRIAAAFTGMDADQLYQWLEAQNFPADVIETFRGNVGRLGRSTFTTFYHCRQ